MKTFRLGGLLILVIAVFSMALHLIDKMSGKAIDTSIAVMTTWMFLAAIGLLLAAIAFRDDK